MLIMEYDGFTYFIRMKREVFKTGAFSKNRIDYFISVGVQINVYTLTLT